MAEVMTGEKELLRALGALRGANRKAAAAAMKACAERCKALAERMERDGLTEGAARLAVDRANLAASIRAGLLREDADALVARLADAQVAALVKDGDPPQFAPVKRVRGGTRERPKYEAERWRHGSRGGVVHVSRDATAERIAEVCGVKDAKGDAKENGKGEGGKADGWTPQTDLEKATDALMKSIGAKHTDAPLGIEGTNPNYSKGREWRINCLRCVPAYEARCRGYDVTAKPCDGNYDGFRFFESGGSTRQRCRGGGKFKTEAESIISAAPEGSRFIVRIKWTGGQSTGAHFFTAKKSGGKAIYENPQNPSEDASSFFANAGRDGNWIMRIDNLKFSQEIADAVRATQTESGQGSPQA